MKAFPRMGITLVVLLTVISGLQASKLDDRNQTVECTCVTTVDCFSQIASLGGNFTARYAETPKEMNATCKAKGAFQSCMQNIPQACNVQSHEMFGKLNDILSFVTKLCDNKTVENQKFLNSSLCYNRNQAIRQNCAKKNAVKGTDAKSLCCRNKKLQDCLQNEMSDVCLKNDTVFQNDLIKKYSSYTNTLCAQYFKYCNGAVSNALSLAGILLTAKVIFLNL